jgi:hypothetical protein
MFHKKYLSKSGLILVLILVLLNSVLIYGQFRFVAYGDSRTNPGPANDIVGGISSQNPELVIHSGDLWDDYTPSEWKSFITARSNLNALLNANKYLVTRGNHEGAGEVLGFSPPIVKNGNLKYYFTEGNCFFVCSEYSPDASFIESALQTTAAQDADWRFLWFHQPIYSAGGHDASGNAAIEALCDQYDVAMTFSGHSHIYERTYLIYNRQVVDTGDDIPAENQGTIYMVTGGGGAPLHGVSSAWWVNTQNSLYHYMVLDAYSDRLEVQTIDINGNVVDSFIRRGVPADPDAPVVSITNPVSDTEYNTLQTISIAADASDPTPGGYITKVDFYVNDVLIDTDTNSPYETSYTFPDFDTYKIMAEATDNQDKTGSSTSTVYVRRLNIALNKPVTSVTPWGNDPALNPLINDGDMNTRWSSLWEQNQYVYIDLEQAYSIDRIVLYWETACGQEYKIQVSSDASNWTDVFHETAGDGGMDEITFTAATGRYVRMLGIVPATGWGFSIWEMQINESMDPIELPAAPSNLAASAVSSSQIDLSWTDNADNEDTFKIEQSPDGSSNWVQIDAVEANVTSYSNTGLNASTTYCYRVSASNSGGDSDYSNSDCAETLAAGEWTELTYDDFESGWGNFTSGGTDCMRYIGGTYAHEGNCAADIQDNSGVGSSFYHTNGIDVHTSGYTQIKVEFWFYAKSMDNSNEDFWVQYYDGATWHTVATYAVQTDFNNNQFYFKIVLIDESSYAFPSDMKIRFMCDASGNADDVYIDEVRVSCSGGSGITLPAAPGNLTATAVSSSQIDLSWTDNADNEDGYKIERKTGSGSFTEIATTGANVTGYSNTGLSASTTYTYRVRAYNTAGNSAYSNEASATTQDSSNENPVITELFRNAYHVWELQRNSIGMYRDSKLFAGTDYHPCSVANVGVGLIALCIADAMGWEPDAAQLAITTLISITGNTPGFNPDRTVNGYYRHWINMDTGAQEWSSEYSTIDTDILSIGAIFCKNYFSGNSTIVNYVDELINSIDFTAAVHSATQGTIYRKMNPDGSGDVTTWSAPYNEYMLSAWLAIHDNNNNTDNAQLLWDQWYNDVSNLPSKEYNGIWILNDHPDHFIPSFANQFNYYYINYFKHNTGYMDYFDRAMQADKLWWANTTSAAEFEWGLGAGASTTPEGYHADEINNNPSNIISPHIIGGNIPINLDSKDDLLWLYNNNKGVYGLPDDLSKKILWRYSVSELFNANTIQGVDYATLLYGLASLPEYLGPDFFDTYNNISTTTIDPPASPSNLSAVSVSSSQIDLSWTDNADNETQFKIERSPNGTSSWTQIAVVGANVTGYSNTGLAASTTYYYRIRASNSGGNSGYSNTANAITDPGSFELHVEAEDFNYMFGVSIEPCSEGGYNVNQIQTGDWMSYLINIPSTGTYTVDYRVTTVYNGCLIKLDRDAGATIIDQNIPVPNTEGWNNWTTVTRTVTLEAGEYFIGIFAQAGGWNFNWFEIKSVPAKAVSDNKTDEAVIKPVAFSLGQNYPNPFNPVTTIQYDLSEQAFVTLKVYNIRGETIATLVKTEQPVGRYHVSFDASELNSGIYLYSITAGAYKDVKRMVFMK